MTGRTPGAASAGYGTYANEGLYPESTSCAGGCGSFARIENAPTNRSTYLDRSDDDGATWANTSEPVGAGLTYAYTKIGNNLNGRVSRTALLSPSAATATAAADTASSRRAPRPPSRCQRG
ncbi:hypothetical protein QFZ75_004819 [Streptomyces sp. V3I8]|nr:hypothetical protein [Streptomyces sp. V3I8]